MKPLVCIVDPKGAIVPTFYGTSRRDLRQAFAAVNDRKWVDMWRLGYRCRSMKVQHGSR